MDNFQLSTERNILDYCLNIENGDHKFFASLIIIQELLKSKFEHSPQLIDSRVTDFLLIALEKGLEKVDYLLLNTTLQCFYNISKMPVGALQDIVDPSFVKRILQLFSNTSAVFRYTKEYEETFKSMFVNKHLVGKVTPCPMISKVKGHILQVSTGVLEPVVALLPDFLHACQLYDTSDPHTDIELSNQLLQKRLAWPSTHLDKLLRSLCSERTDSTESWEDVFVTGHIYGPLFWAHVGISKMKTVVILQNNLAKYFEAMHSSTNHYPDGKSVIVCTNLGAEKNYLRGYVMHKAGEDYKYRVWTYDYGFTVDVLNSHMCPLPSKFSIDVIPSQISICYLRGIQAPPCDENLPKTGAAILCNLFKKSIPACEIFSSLEGISTLESFLESCYDSDSLCYIYQILQNFAFHGKNFSKVSSSNLAALVLDKVKYLHEKQTDDPKKALTMSAALLSLINILHKNEEQKMQFFNHKGLETLVEIMVDENPRKGKVYSLCAQVLNMFTVKNDMHFKTEGQKNDFEYTYTKDRSSPHGLHDDLMKNGFLRSPTREVLRKSRGEKDIFSNFQSPVQEQDNEHCHLVKSHNQLSSCSGDDTDEELLLSNRLKFSGNNQVNITVNGSGTPEKNPSLNIIVYVKDAVVNMENSSVCEFRTNKTMDKVSSSLIAKHVCGMLNSGLGGCIFFGVHSTVFGVKLQREDRDKFRLGVDQMMNKLNPGVIHSQYDIRYTAVTDRSGSAIPDLFIVEIKVSPYKGTIYIPENGQCYYRFGAKTISVNPQEMRQLIVQDEEKKYSEKIMHLRKKLADLQAKLQV